MSKPSLAIFCHNLEINGANMFVLSLARALSADFLITVFSFREGAMRARLDKLCRNIEVLDDSFDRQILMDYSLVAINTLFNSRVVGDCQKLQIPHFLVVHETWPPTQLRYYVKELWAAEGLIETDIIHALGTAHHVVFAARYLGDVYSSLVDQERSSTIYCTIDMAGIDRYLESHDRKSARAALGIPDDALFFIQMGTVTRRKAQLLTFKAFASLVDSGDCAGDLRLALVGARRFRPGEREYIDEISALIREYDLGESVVIHDVQEDPYPFYLAADILVHPSLNEVLPLAICEALYCGLPVIGSNLDGIPEIITHERHGLLTNPSDLPGIETAMKRLAMSPGLRAELGQEGRKKVAAQHGEAEFTKRYRDLAQKLCSTLSAKIGTADQQVNRQHVMPSQT
jgi:D-inositol-3-phosphate glycosyltransferase